MRSAEAVVFAFGALGEARKPTALPQRADLVAPRGQYLVRIGLMAYIPDQSVARRIENVVQRHGQFDNAEAGSEVTSGRRNSADRFGPQFVGDLSELTLAQVPQIGRRFDGVEKWC